MPSLRVFVVFGCLAQFSQLRFEFRNYFFSLFDFQQ